MLILAIDTSTRSGSVSILQNRQVLAEVASEEETPYSDRLFRDISMLRSGLRIELSNIDLFAVASGPGLFTGLRVGLAAVKGWGEIYKRPIAMVSVLEAIAAQAGNEHETVAAFLDARRGQVYGAVFVHDAIETEGGPHLRRIGEEVVLAAEEYLSVVQGQTGGRAPLFVSPTPAAVPQDAINTIFQGAKAKEVSGILAPVIGLLGFECAQRGEAVDPLTVDANYIRRSDAELFWKGG